MDRCVHYDQLWAVSKDRIEEFFKDCGIILCNGKYTGGTLCVCVEEAEPVILVGQEMPRCRLILTGDADTVTAIYRKFELKFLSAGG